MESGGPLERYSEEEVEEEEEEEEEEEAMTLDVEEALHAQLGKGVEYHFFENDPMTSTYVTSLTLDFKNKHLE